MEKIRNKKFTARLFLYLFFFFGYHSVFAQDANFHRLPNSVDYNRGFGMHLNIPTITLGSESNINQFLEEIGYPGIPKLAFNWGIGLSYRMSNFIGGMDVLIGNQQRSNEFTRAETLVRPLHANIWAGYYSYKWSMYALYPLTGLYITDTNYIFSKDVGDSNFEDLFFENKNATNLQNLSAGLFLGLGFDMNRVWTKDTPLISLKFGYRMPAFGAFEWESYFAQINNPPAERFGHWYLQLQFGFMSNWKKGAF